MKDWSEFKQMLLAKRKEILGRLAEVEDELDDPLPKDWEDRATELQYDEIAEGLGHVELEELRAIDMALKRIEEGTYGICASCGAEIRPERLKAVPWTAVCAECARG